jgi:hypothetical protein
MKFKYLLSVIAIVAISKSTFAQYAKDAVNFSTFQTGATSRIKAIGNAGTAIGGDLSSIGGNPAGLGFFTKSEFSITPEFDGSKNKSSYLGQSNSANKNGVNFSNASIVFYSRLNTPSGTDKTKGWLSLNFGVGFNRTNDFNQNIYYSGKNSSSSINDYYASLANSSGIQDGTLPGWAYSDNLIDRYPDGYARNNHQGASVNQLNSINRTGGQSEFNLSLGANYSNKLYLGFGIGITDLRYNSTNNFNETGVVSVLENGADVDHNYNSVYSQYQDTRGSGVNAKFGVIYKILESLRVGATITTPTYISIDDSYSEGLATNLSGGTSTTHGPSDYPLSYNMRTPFKAAGGLSLFINQFGFISGDVEYIDYSTTHISSNDDYDGTFDNSTIKANYRATVNAHVGAEIKLASAISLRGGYGIQGSPLKNNGSSTKTVSGGLGYRFGSYYVDATYLHLAGTQNITPYSIGALTPSATINNTNNNVFLTLGYRY